MIARLHSRQSALETFRAIFGGCFASFTKPSMQLAGRVPHSAVAQLGCSGRHHSNLLQRCTLTNSIRGPLNTADSSDTVLPSNALAKRRFSSGRSLHSRARQKLPACTTAFKRDRFISSSQVCSAEVIHSSSPQVQFGTTADLLTSLRAFTAMQKPTLSDVCTVQVQLKLAENKVFWFPKQSKRRINGDCVHGCGSLGTPMPVKKHEPPQAATECC